MTRARYQVSLQRMMLFVLISAGLVWAYRNGLLSMVPTFGVMMLIFAGVFGWVVRDLRRTSAWGFGLASLVANGVVTPCCVYLVRLEGYALMGLVMMASLPIMLGFGVAWARQATRIGATWRRPRWLAWTMVVILIGLPLTMMVERWPLRLAFALSRPALEAMADRVSDGRRVKTPEWAGLYRVVRSRFDPASGEVALVIDDNRYGRSGFLRLPRGIDRGRSGLFTNLNFNEELDHRWRYQNED